MEEIVQEDFNEASNRLDRAFVVMLCLGTGMMPMLAAVNQHPIQKPASARSGTHRRPPLALFMKRLMCHLVSHSP